MIRYIYTFFVGLFLAIFVGMGIAVFYPEPVPPDEPAVFQTIGKEGPTTQQQAEIDKYNLKRKDYDQKQWHHNKYVSVIVLVCSVIILAVALSLNEKLGVIADGVLLGGIFTLLYGIGRGMATDSNKFRFIIASIGLAGTIILGYLKFVRRHLERTLHTTGNVMLKILLWLLAVAVLSTSIYGTYSWQHKKVDSLNKQVGQLTSENLSLKNSQSTKTSFQYSSEKGVKINLYKPTKNSTVTSPLIILGEVPGNWSFEASFPVKIVDSKGQVIAQAPAQLLGDWMTDKLVPFSLKLGFESAPSGEGSLVLQKDNPSGLESNEDKVIVPIRF